MHIEEIKNAGWKIVKHDLTHCPDEIRFDDFLKLFEAIEHKPELRKLATLRFHVTNTFGKRKWIDLSVGTWIQHDGWEFDLVGTVYATPRNKAISGIHPGMTFRIVGYVPTRRSASRFELLRSQD